MQWRLVPPCGSTVFGPVEALVDGRSLPLGGRRQRTLLAILLVERGRVVSTDRLAAALWEERPPTGAATTIRSYVSRLRSAIGPDVVRSRPNGYLLELDPEQLDVHRFEELLQQGETALRRGAAGLGAERLGEALALWRGQALADTDSSTSLDLEARRLDALRLVALEHRIEAELELGRHVELVPELERLVAAEPLRERPWAQLVLALYRSGRQAEALEAYRRVRATLVDELGIEPGDELKQLERAVLLHEVREATPAVTRHNLPGATTSFVGREMALSDVAGLLREHRLVTLTGVGGAGKTRLALEVADRQLGAWRDGVWLVDLTPLADPALVAGAAAAALDMADPGLQGLDVLRSHLREAEVLLVLDNCEHLLDGCAELAQVLLADCERAAAHHEPRPARPTRRDGVRGHRPAGAGRRRSPVGARARPLGQVVPRPRQKRAS